MFCPHCSQQQVSAEVRFCSRCGFPLEGVAQLLANGGVLPSAAAATELGPRSPRANGVRQGALMWLIGILVLPFLILLVEELRVLPEAVAMMGAMLFFLGGFVRMVYALFFEDGPLRRQKIAPLASNASARLPQQFGAGWQQPRDASALPPAQSVPANAYVPPRADTAEIARERPPSVTENTTRLLDKEQH